MQYLASLVFLDVHGLTHLSHSLPGHGTGLCAPGYKHVHGFLGMRRIISSLLVQGLQIRKHVPNEHALAIDAANIGSAAALCHFLAFGFGTVDAMEVEYRTQVRIARIPTALPGWVSHHRLHFLREYGRAVREIDSIIIALAHFAAIETWQLGDFGQLRLRL